jgi:hypothetical protein
VVACLALAVALGGAAYASIPGPDGTIHSCLDGRGSMRVIDSSASCGQAETPLNFSQTGPQGPPGQSQLLTFAHDISVKVPRKASGAPIGSFDLPAGKWAITFTGGVNIAGFGRDVTCRLALGDGSVRQTVGNGALIGLLVPAVQTQHNSGGGGGAGRLQRLALNLHLVHDVPTGGERGFLACRQPAGNTSAPVAVVQDVSIIAVRVDKVGQLNFTPGR